MAHKAYYCTGNTRVESNLTFLYVHLAYFADRPARRDTDTKRNALPDPLERFFCVMAVLLRSVSACIQMKERRSALRVEKHQEEVPTEALIKLVRTVLIWLVEL